MTLLLLDNYDSFTYNLYQRVQAQTEAPVEVLRNDALDFDALRARRPGGVILSPGPGHPGVEKDFGLCREVILRQSELDCPVLGVCLGMQGIVHHLGGRVISAPEVMHGKTSEVEILEETQLLAGLSNPFTVMRYHSLAVEEASLPPDLIVTARDKTHGLVMALEHKSRPLYGVQFHPESIGTPEGDRLLGNFVELCLTKLAVASDPPANDAFAMSAPRHAYHLLAQAGATVEPARPASGSTPGDQIFEKSLRPNTLPS